MRTLSEQFISRVEGFLRASQLKTSEFGRQSVGDPNFIVHLRRGRSPTLGTADRVLAYIDKLEADAAVKLLNRKKP
jgi:hypothetical protein